MRVKMELNKSDEGWSIVVGSSEVYSLDTGPFESPEAAFGRICKQILLESRESFFKKYSVEEAEKLTSGKEA